MSVSDQIASASESAVDKVVLAIREMISQEGLRVGDRLPTERELCTRFNAGRNTVREAIRMLKAYGVVEVRPKVGATIVDNRFSRALDLFAFNVGELSRQTFIDIQDFRELIETGAVLKIFDAAGPEELAELRAINAEMARASSVVEASEHDFRFHAALVALLGNKSVLDVYQIMKPVILRIMQRGKTKRVIEYETMVEHEGILRAIETRDGVAYQYLMRAHLRRGLALFKEVD